MADDTDTRQTVILLHDATGTVRRIRIGDLELKTLTAGHVMMQGQSTVNLTLDNVLVQHETLPGVEHTL